MPTIATIERYKYNGKEYKTIDAVKTDVENAIGCIIDTADVTLSPKQKLHLFKTIVKNKKTLVELLRVELEVPGGNGLHHHCINILDY